MGDDDAGAAAAGRESSDGDAGLLSRQKGERLEALTELVVGTATDVLKVSYHPGRRVVCELSARVVYSWFNLVNLRCCL